MTTNIYTRYLITALLIFLCAGDAIGQVIYNILSTDLPITIHHGKHVKLYTSKGMREYPIYENDTLITQQGAAHVRIEINHNNGGFWLPDGYSICASDLIKYSFFRLDPHYPYYKTVIKYFRITMHNDESKESYKNDMNEVGGASLGTSYDFLRDGEYKNDLRPEDADSISNVEKSLKRKKIKDPVMYDLEKAYFFERRQYFGRAYELFKSAKEESKNLSPIVNMAYDQFLYRMGRFEN
jgi:hypothetical protein